MSTTAQKLQAAQAHVQELEEQLAAEQQAMAASTPEVRALAVRLHTKLCPDSHPDGCSWHTGASHVDDPEATDWTEPAHAAWLERARVGLSSLLAVGYTVYPPGSTTPLPSSAAE